MRLFFAGSEASKFRTILNECGAKNVLMSFYWIKNGKDLEELSKDFTIFMDSGGYSARKQGVDIDVEKYGDFLEQHKDFLFAAANLDVYDLNIALQNQEKLSKQYPVLPVYHFTEYASKKFSLLEEWCKKYPYIAIGGMAGTNLDKGLLKNFLNFVFKTTIPYKTKVHGFGLTATHFLLDYPFYSTDSTTWLTGGQYGQLLHWNEKMCSMENNIHYSNKDKFLEHNLDTALTGGYRERLVHNVKEILKMEKDITRVWAERKVVFDN